MVMMALGEILNKERHTWQILVYQDMRRTDLSFSVFLKTLLLIRFLKPSRTTEQKRMASIIVLSKNQAMRTEVWLMSMLAMTWHQSS